MTQQMFRWQIPVDGVEHTIAVGKSDVITHVATVVSGPFNQHVVEFWTLGKGDFYTARTFIAVGTGEPMEDEWTFIGTAGRVDGLVWHLWEKKA